MYQSGVDRTMFSKTPVDGDCFIVDKINKIVMYSEGLSNTDRHFVYLTGILERGYTLVLPYQHAAVLHDRNVHCTFLYNIKEVLKEAHGHTS